MQSEDSASGEQRVVFLVVNVDVHTANDARLGDASVLLHGCERAGPFRAVDFIEATARVGIRLRRDHHTTVDRQTRVLLESNHLVRMG